MIPGLEHMGRALLMMGGVIFLVGLIFTFAGKIPYLGRLPGDFVFRRGNVSCAVPIATSLALSLILTVILNLVLALLRRGGP